MSDITGLITGLAQGINNYMGTKIQADQKSAQMNQQNQFDMQKEAYKQGAETTRQVAVEQAKRGMDDVLTPDMAEKVLPGVGGKMITQYNQQNPDKPLKVKDGVDYLKAASDALNPDTTKIDNHQDVLENQSMERLINLRKDQNVVRTAAQRDAAGQAYDTIVKAQSEHRPLSELEQTDVIGQLAKARFGTVSDTILKEMNEQTGKRDFNHLITYATGNPTLVGASTDDTLNNLKQFVVSTGKKADQQYDGYMGPHLVKPTGIHQDRWDNVVSRGHGISFSDQMGVSDKTYSAQKAPASNGWSYVGPVK